MQVLYTPEIHNEKETHFLHEALRVNNANACMNVAERAGLVWQKRASMLRERCANVRNSVFEGLRRRFGKKREGL